MKRISGPRKKKLSHKNVSSDERRDQTPTSPHPRQTPALLQHQTEPQDLRRDSEPSPVKFDAEEQSSSDASDISDQEVPKPTNLNQAQKNSNATTSSTLNSFSSISSLTPPASGRRINKNGEEAVPNSDSEDGDSDSSLEDIDEIMARQKATSTLASFQGKRNVQGLAGSAFPAAPRLQSATSRSKTGKVTKSERSYQWNLSSLVHQSNSDSAAKERIERAQNVLEAENEKARKDTEARKKAEEGQAQENGAIDEAYFASIVDDSDAEEDPQRVMAAIRRTEALQQDLAWHFFKDEPTVLSERDPFPAKALPETGWMTTLTDTWERQQACLTGFVADMARLQQLPSEIITWMLDEAIFEPREDLAYAYLSILEKCPQAIKRILTIPRLSALFGKLGGKNSIITVEEPVAPTFRSPESRPPAPAELCRLLRALDNFAQCNAISVETRGYALKILLRLGMDDAIRADGQLLFGLEDAILALASSDGRRDQSNWLAEIGTSIFATVQHAQLGLRLLQRIPGVNPQMEDFRRRLALCFFLNDKVYLSCSLQKPSISSEIIAHLRSAPLYDPDPKTNYADLGALISILDIAINSGFATYPFPSKEAEIDFNNSVDALSQQITTLHNSIVDTGASHMKRTEAKNTLERLKFRLEFGVRTKPRPKKSVFGDSAGRNVLDGYAQDADVMTKFLGKEKGVHVAGV
ncbi:MAG: hypothetical protein M1822_001687 [Bathelium mastoideum]|nr:MAG: hypothetical protein M1822_001687 [Bathelium mastoideum]